MVMEAGCVCRTAAGLTYVHATKTYWMSGKSKRIVAYDPRTPANITSYIKDTSRFDEFSISKLHQVRAFYQYASIAADNRMAILDRSRSWWTNPLLCSRIVEQSPISYSAQGKMLLASFLGCLF